MKDDEENPSHSDWAVNATGLNVTDPKVCTGDLELKSVSQIEIAEDSIVEDDGRAAMEKGCRTVVWCLAIVLAAFVVLYVVFVCGIMYNAFFSKSIPVEYTRQEFGTLYAAVLVSSAIPLALLVVVWANHRAWDGAQLFVSESPVLSRHKNLVVVSQVGMGLVLLLYASLLLYLHINGLSVSYLDAANLADASVIAIDGMEECIRSDVRRLTYTLDVNASPFQEPLNCTQTVPNGEDCRSYQQPVVVVQHFGSTDVLLWMNVTNSTWALCAEMTEPRGLFISFAIPVVWGVCALLIIPGGVMYFLAQLCTGVALDHYMYHTIYLGFLLLGFYGADLLLCLQLLIFTFSGKDESLV